MVLKQIDFEAVKDGSAHTSEAPKEVSAFIKMSKKEIKDKIEEKLPKIKEGYEKRLLAKCLEIKSGIKSGKLQGQDLNNQLVYLRYSRGNGYLFQNLTQDLTKKYMENIISGSINEENIHNLQLEIDFLNLYNLGNFLGETTGANVVLLNAMMQFRVEDVPEITNQYILSLLDAIIYTLTKVPDKNIPSSIDYLQLKKDIDIFFKYHIFSYDFDVIGENNYKNIEILRILLWHLPPHIYGDIKTLKIINNGTNIEISGDYGVNNKIKEGGQIPNSYIGQLDAGNFIKWLVEKNSDILSLRFDEENHKFIFTLKQ